MFAQIIVLSNSLITFSRSSNRLIRVTIVTLCILLFTYRLPNDGLMPYYFYWQL